VRNEDGLDCWWVEDVKVGKLMLERYYQENEEWALPLRMRLFPVNVRNE
jgi:hypothetical protein